MKACSACGVAVARKGRCLACRKARRAEARVLAPSYAFKCQGCGAKSRSQAMFCRACKPEGRGGRKTLIPCPRCGKDFWPWANGKHERKTCGCKAQPKMPTPPPAKPCAWCRGDFVPKTGGKRYCSPRCVKAATHQRKHVRRRGLRLQGVVSTQEIYLRDGGICGLCQGHVEPDFEGTRKGLPGAPVIDHILPVSKGGKHERSNLQLAHWRCNTIKGNRVEPLRGAPPGAWGGGADANQPAA